MMLPALSAIVPAPLPPAATMRCPAAAAAADRRSAGRHRQSARRQGGAPHLLHNPYADVAEPAGHPFMMGASKRKGRTVRAPAETSELNDLKATSRLCDTVDSTRLEPHTTVLLRDLDSSKLHPCISW